jgi:hypothetical protein
MQGGESQDDWHRTFLMERLTAPSLQLFGCYHISKLVSCLDDLLTNAITSAGRGAGLHVAGLKREMEADLIASVRKALKNWNTTGEAPDECMGGAPKGEGCKGATSSMILHAPCGP